jgi:pyruvate formate lyase activating enzyme
MQMSPRRDRTDNDRGLIFNIQRFSLHDGSGIRTLVFLKGCPLSCAWCSNPEGQAHTPELAYNAKRCIGTVECGRCRDTCDAGAVREDGDGRIEIDRDLCTNCGECVDACPSNALELFGKHMSVDEIIRVVEEDSSFYARSDGGITLSGGEPLSQPRFAVQLLEEAQRRGMDTALETCGHVRWEDLERACRHLNQLFFDIKLMDSKRHREATGVGNELIIENFRRVCDSFPRLPVIARTPVIPGFNDTDEDIQAIADFVGGMPARPVYELLAYHRFGEPKYQQLGKPYPLAGLVPLPEERIALLRGRCASVTQAQAG